MYDRILVGTDGSGTATRAVATAARIACTHGSELVVAHAYRVRLPAAVQRDVDRAPEEIRWRLTSGQMAEDVVAAATAAAERSGGPGLRVHGRCEPGSPVPVLLDLIEDLDPDVLVIGNRDMPGRFRLASVGRALLRRATCDVIVVDTLGRRERRRHHQRGVVVPRLA